MSTMFGADADALDEVAADLERRAERVRTARVRLARAIHGSPWEGPVAQRFRQQWEAEHGPTLLAAAGFLDAAGDVLRRNATQQRDVSGGDGALGEAGAAPTFSDDALGAVEATSLFDLGDSDQARTILLLLGLVPGLGTFIVAEDLRQLIVDLAEGDATAQQVEDRVLDVIGLYPPIGWALAGREAVGILLPDDLEDPIFTVLGLDPSIDEVISNVDAVRRGDWGDVDLLELMPSGLMPGSRLSGFRDLYGALRRRVD